ncbi:MAG: YfhO family protein [Lachnospiraceae bacterium]|nr:YfhO family protein [Lachnospiraceae bacterium]
MRKRLHYILPSVITMVLYSIILAVKGIYPFGNNTIDYYDMAQQIAAFYYHTYDWLHGTKSFFYDWYTALGVNMAMSTSGCSNISPFNLFFLFIKRDSLLKSLSVFNGLKLMCMSFTMYFYLHRTYKSTPLFFKAVASVGYAFCGFVLVLYITNQWVDIAVMFPLIMYFYDRLIETGRIKGYVITLAITLIASYYLGFMILIFIFLYTGLKLVTGPIFKEEKRDMNLLSLGNGTLLSLMSSAFILVPQLMQMLSSARFKNGNEGEADGAFGRYIEIISRVKGDYTTRWWTLLGVSFAAAVILTGLIRYRKDKKLMFTTLSLILMMVLELFFESINLIWHFGSYVQYPIRNGFIINFVFAYLMCLYAGKMYGEEDVHSHRAVDAEETEKVSDVGNGYLSFAVTIFGFLIFIAFMRNHPGMQLRRVFHITSFMMLVTFICYFFLLNSQKLIQISHYIGRNTNKSSQREGDKTYAGKGDADSVVNSTDDNTDNIGNSNEDNTGSTGNTGNSSGDKEGHKQDGKESKRYGWAAGIMALEILCYGFLLFGKPDFITGYAEEPEQDGEFIYTCNELRDRLDLDSDFLTRIKNPDESLNANYGLVLMQPALSNWTHMIAPGEQTGAAAWGYTIQFTRLLDAGGTVFSDALLGICKVISSVPMDECLYEPVASARVTTDHRSGDETEYTMYRPEYMLPFGILLGSSDTDNPAGEGSYPDVVQLHNSIYHSMITRGAKPTEDIAHWIIRKEHTMEPDELFSSAGIDTEAYLNGRTVTINATIEDECALYLLGSGGDMEYANCTIEVMGGSLSGTDNSNVSDDGYTMIGIPTIKDPGNVYYPAHFNNNAVYLGCFGNEKARIRVTMDLAKGEPFDVDIMGLSMDAVKYVCEECIGISGDNMSAGGRTLDFDVSSAGSDSCIMLPLTYDKGWKIRINGQKVKAEQYAGLFMRFPLFEGDNKISMRFTPQGTAPGVLVTVLALVMMFVYIVLRRISPDALEHFAESVVDLVSPAIERGYLVVFVLAVMFVYIVPVLYGLFILARGAG